MSVYRELEHNGTRLIVSNELADSRGEVTFGLLHVTDPDTYKVDAIFNLTEDVVIGFVAPELNEVALSVLRLARADEGFMKACMDEYLLRKHFNLYKSIAFYQSRLQAFEAEMVEVRAAAQNNNISEQLQAQELFLNQAMD